MGWIDREKVELDLDEGNKLESYPDQYGNWTIGRGHLLGKDPKYKGIIWTPEKSDETFEQDVEDKINDCQNDIYVFPGLDGPRKGAILNMAFQMGAKTVATFHATLNFLDQSKYDEAALQIMNSLYARQTPERAKRIAYRIRTGDYAKR